MWRICSVLFIAFALITITACDSGTTQPAGDGDAGEGQTPASAGGSGAGESAAKPDPAVAKAAFDEALKLIDTGRLQDAAGQLDEAIRNDPHFAQAYVARAKLQLEHGDAQAGLDDIDRALAIDQELVSAYLARAAYYESTDDPADKARAEADMTAVHQIRGTKPLPKEVQKETKSIFDKVLKTDSELKP